MMILAALLLQTVQPAPAPAASPLPEIQLDVRATARRVVVENRGRTSLTVRTSANGRQGEENIVEVEAPELPQGRRDLSNVKVHIRVETRISDPLAPPAPKQEPAEPQ